MSELGGYLFVGGIANGRWIATRDELTFRVPVPMGAAPLSTTHRGLDPFELRYHLYFRETLLLFGRLVTVFLHEDDRLPGAREWALVRALMNENGRDVYEQGTSDVLSPR